MRLRTKDIVDIKISLKEIKRLKKGYRIYHIVDGKTYCLVPDTDRRVQRVIDKLRERIKELEGKKKK